MIHECKYKKGRIIEVVTRNNNKDIYCKWCGEKLKESQVDKKMLRLIKSQIYKKNGNRRT